MARTISWQADLRDIHRKVDDSPRTPYGRADLQKLFRLGPRAALDLIALMPRVGSGNQVVVEREDLLAFLNGALDAEDLRAYLDALRARPPKPKKRKLRYFVPRDFEPGNLATIDRLGIRIRRGELTLLFRTPDQLASLLLQLSTVIELPEFDRRYCVPPALSLEAARAQDDVSEMFAELAVDEAAFATRSSAKAGPSLAPNDDQL